MRQNNRNGSIDVLRGLAAFGIVWFHAAAPFAQVAYSGLTVFFLLLVLHHPPPPTDLDKMLRSRADRLLRPWFVWSVIFAVAKISQAVVAGLPIAEEFAPWMLLTGPGLHLWFLPFGYVVLMGLSLIQRRSRPNQRFVFGLTLALTSISLTLAATLVQSARYQPLTEWAAAIGPLAVAASLRASDNSFRQHLLVLAATLMSALIDYSVHGNMNVAVPLG